MPKILALDTSTEMCSVALQVGDELLARAQLAPQKHAELILPMIDELLAEAHLSLAQLDAIAFGQGPGSFMGLRIGVGVVQGLAYGVDKPVIPVSSLQALAQNAYQSVAATKVVVGVDARMQAIYWGGYELDVEKVMQGVLKDNLSKSNELNIENAETYIAAGNAWKIYADQLSMNFKSIHADLYPTAKAMLAIAIQKFQRGEIVKAEEAEPYYIRDQVTN